MENIGLHRRSQPKEPSADPENNDIQTPQQVTNPCNEVTHTTSGDVIEILSSDDENDVEVVSSHHRATPVIDLDAETSTEFDDDVEITASRNRNQGGSEDDIQIIHERPLVRHHPAQNHHHHHLNHVRISGNLPAMIHTPVGEFETTELVQQMRNTINPLPAHLASSRRVGTRRAIRQTIRSNDSFVQYQWLINRLNQSLADHNLHFLHDSDFGAFNNEDNISAVENSIMRRIEHDNDQALDSRLANERVFNRKTFDDKKTTAQKELSGYTNAIDSNHEICCEVCGVILGQGIDGDFKPDPRYNHDLEKYMQMCRVHAPWFCIKQCSEADIDLSKRVFSARCGHVFCGRCVKNIGNRPKKTKATPTSITIDNPDYFAPRKCPAPECGKRFSAKGFKEAYF
jgi:hypothetical protein